ncbi:hypothetical protein D0Z07_6697 [Hyphodiscus hymeniophilus]|uniref:Rhodopsin domain-containing protein n=1 Tax=Hyphodiscus hymeniophilus TaxID=353542 RepID=A0A9P6VGI6_9HELO|nr:hypothetical protein D0Z07_6697 [Hyphodiscus hymeniophilus]
MECIERPNSDFPENETYFCTNQALSVGLENQRGSESVIVPPTLFCRVADKTLCRQPVRDRTKLVSVSAIVGVSLAALTFALRLLARTMSCQLGLDDWSMIAAMGFVIPLSALAVFRTSNSGKIYYFDELLYLGSLTLIRISILCCYLRIFPQRTFKRTVYVILAGNVIYGTAFVLISGCMDELGRHGQSQVYRCESTGMDKWRDQHHSRFHHPRPSNARVGEIGDVVAAKDSDLVNFWFRVFQYQETTANHQSRGLCSCGILEHNRGTCQRHLRLSAGTPFFVSEETPS